MCENLTAYHNRVKVALAEDSQTNAEDVILEQKGEDGEKTKVLTSNLKEEKSAMEETVETIKKDPYSKAKEATAGLNKSPKLNVDIAFLLAFDFVLDPVSQEYVFCCGSLAVGGTFSFNKTWYTNIEGVPVFINLTGTIQLSGLQTYNTDAGKNALTAGDFDSYAGNLAERLSASQGLVDLMLSIKVQVGEGICGVLAARGFVTVKLQFELYIDNATTANRDYKLGAMISASGGVGYDLLLFSINIEYGNITAGWGTLETQPDFSFFGGLLDIPLSAPNKTVGQLFGLDGNKDAVLEKSDDGKQVMLHQYSSGTSDMSGFGKSNGRKMMVFIGNRGGTDTLNSMALYYAIYDGSKWSEPRIVADDGTVDSTPDIMKKGDKVIIAWADASRKFTSDDINNNTKKLDLSTLSTMNISVAVYDISSGSMGDEVTLIDDGYFNLSPQLDIDGTKLYCSYMKRDVVNAKDEKDLLDLTKLYSTMAYVTYDFGGETQGDGEKLGVDETYYKDSPYAEIADGNFRSDSANFRQKADITTSISDYKLVTDGKDIYIFFTDFGSEESSTGVEVYGVKYQRVVRDEESAKKDSGTEEKEVSSEDCWGFGKAVQITDENKVIDEMDLYMAEDDKISLVSNYHSQWIDKNGNMQYGTNQIVEIEFETANSLPLEEDAITLPSRLVGGENDQLTFKVKNNGLLAAKGFDYTVSQVTGGTGTVIEQGHSNDILESGESVSLNVPWPVPESVSDTSIKVTVTESGLSNSKPVTMMKKVPYGSSLNFEDTQVLWDGNTPYVKTTLTNKGNAASRAYSGILSMVDSNNKEVKTYNEFSVPALASGESKTFELPFTPAVDDFSALGIINLKLTVTDGKESIETHYARLVSSSPVCAQINGGEKKIELAYGKTTTLKTKVAPWEGIAGDVRFYSSDEAVAIVDNKGVVTGTGNGEATITAYYANVGVSVPIDVSVSGKTGDEPMPGTDGQTQTSAATKKLTVKKNSAVIAAGKSKEIAYVAKTDSLAAKAAPVTVSVSGNKKVTAKIVGSKVKVTVGKKAVKGSTATVTLKSQNAAGKNVKAAIRVRVQNKAKKLTAAKQSITVKKGKKAKLTLKVTVQNRKKAITDKAKVSSGLVALAKQSSGKGRITLTLKGKKKGSKKVTVKVGSKKVKVKVKIL